jgi:hypothetical protein
MRHIRLTIDIPVPDAEDRPSDTFKRIEFATLDSAVTVALWGFAQSLRRHGMPNRNIKYKLEYFRGITDTRQRKLPKDALGE